MTTTMTNLSLSYCAPDDFVPYSPWNQLNKPPPPPSNIDNTTTTTTTSQSYPPLLYGHDAITTVYNDTEWMIVTGGQLSTSYLASNEFYVWLLNLTHANLFDEEIWLQMTYNNNNNSSQSSSTSASAFGVDMMYSINNESNGDSTNKCDLTSTAGTLDTSKSSDPWERQDIWETDAAVLSCAPGPRHDHLTAVINDYLYVFGGYSNNKNDKNPLMDLHTHRIHLDDVLANDWSGWKRILPRTIMNVTESNPIFVQGQQQLAFRGGLWHDPNEVASMLPKLIVLTGLERAEHGVAQFWAYDFTEDEWSLFYEPLDTLRLQNGNYAVALFRDYFVIKTKSPQDNGQYWIDLMSKTVYFTQNIGFETNQRVISYTDDQNTDEAIVIGYGGSNPDFDITVANFESQDHYSVFSTKNLEILDRSKRPPERIGHTAVLSSNGKMYIFGGRSVINADKLVTDKLLGVWRLDVGSKEGCKLHLIADHEQDVQSDDYFRGYDDYSYDDNTNNDDYQVVDASWLFVIWVGVVGGGVLCCLKRRPDTSQQQQQGNDVDDADNSTTTTRAILLDQDLDNMFPVRQVSVLPDATQQQDGEVNDRTHCMICLNRFQNGEFVRDLFCGHSFHQSCVDNWLKQEASCPLCRASCLRIQEESTVIEQHQHAGGGTIARLDEIDQQPQHQEPPTRVHNNNNNNHANIRNNNRRRRKEKEEEGLEMMSVYSLELFEEDEVDGGGGGNDGGESVYSIMTAPANVVRRSGERRRRRGGGEHGRKRGRRRQRRVLGMLGNKGNDDDDERSAPLTESSSGAMC